MKEAINTHNLIPTTLEEAIDTNRQFTFIKIKSEDANQVQKLIEENNVEYDIYNDSAEICATESVMAYLQNLKDTSIINTDNIKQNIIEAAQSIANDMGSELYFDFLDYFRKD